MAIIPNGYERADYNEYRGGEIVTYESEKTGRRLYRSTRCSETEVFGDMDLAYQYIDKVADLTL